LTLDLELAGKSILIAGGSRGIGLAIAQAFAREGARLSLMARNRQGLEAAMSSLGSDCSLHEGDATDPTACAAVVDAVSRQRDRLDILVACTGSGASVPPGEETAAEWQRVVALNLFSATNMITAATPLLARSAPASIVCISSICGREALGAPVTYSAAKAGLNAAVNGLARPLARQGIRINTVSPGNILFPGGTWDRKLRENEQAVAGMLDRDVPMRRLGKPEWVADAVLFLASARAAFITGTDLVVDGGQTRS